MAWEENSCISLNMQLIAILSRIGVFIHVPDDRLAWQVREHVGHETVAVPP